MFDEANIHVIHYICSSQAVTCQIVGNEKNMKTFSHQSLMKEGKEKSKRQKATTPNLKGERSLCLGSSVKSLGSAINAIKTNKETLCGVQRLFAVDCHGLINSAHEI